VKQDNNELGHIPSPEELISIYNNATQNDPRSVNYKRVLIRPNIHLIKTLFHILFCLALISIIGILLHIWLKNLIISILSPIALLIIYIIIRIKALIIWCIKCYQRFAPDKVRNKCRFEPSCSNYMLIAIDKYGLIKGIKKGKDRLKRCCPPNGGYDEP